MRRNHDGNITKELVCAMSTSDVLGKVAGFLIRLVTLGTGPRAAKKKKKSEGGSDEKRNNGLG